MASPDGGNAQNFAGRRYSGPAFCHTVVDHGGHAGAHRGLVDSVAVGLGVNEAEYAFVNLQDLEDADTSPVPGTAASLAAFGFVDCFADGETERTKARIGCDVGRSKVVFDLAAVAQLPHQSLCNHGA